VGTNRLFTMSSALELLENRLLLDSATAEIRGVLWNDLNGDGICQEGEAGVGLPGRIVYLDLNRNGIRDDGEPSAVTGDDGAYAFTGLAAGTYYANQVLLPSWKQTSPAVPADDLFALGSGDTTPTIYRLDPATGSVLGSFTPADQDASVHKGMAAGQRRIFVADGSSTTLRVVEYDSLTGAALNTYHLAAPSLTFNTIEGAAWLAGKLYLLTNDGGLLEWPLGSDLPPRVFYIPYSLSTTGGLTADPDRGTFFSTTSHRDTLEEFDPATPWPVRDLPLNGFSSTDFPFIGLAYADGELLAGLPDGTVCRIDPETGFTRGSFTVPGTTSLAALGGDGDPFRGIAVTLTEGQVATGQNFGNYYPPPVTISGTSFTDLDGDGVRDPGEPALAGRVVYLDQNRNGLLDTGELRTTTGQDGSYRFADLPAGTYYVNEVPQTGWAQSLPAVPQDQKLAALMTVSGGPANLYAMDPLTGATLTSMQLPLAGLTYPGLALGQGRTFVLDNIYSSAMPKIGRAHV
jgi:hypothetical protein